MLELVRTTTIGAESRVNRFYNKGGATSVVNEIRNLESDHVKAHYASLLMKQNVPVAEYGMIANGISGTIDSDHYMAEFLKNNVEKFMQNKEATEALFAATRRMDSDHYKTEVIKEALHSGPVSLESVRIIMQATGNMDSDHYKTEVMTSLLRQTNLTDGVVGEMINTTKTIGSDHYLTKRWLCGGFLPLPIKRLLNPSKTLRATTTKQKCSRTFYKKIFLQKH